MSNTDDFEVTMIIHRETEKAWLASKTGDKNDAVWLPKSQIVIIEDEEDKMTMSIPSWLAVEKKLV